MSDNVVTYAPRGAALDLMKYKGREALMSGAAGTGKSVCCLMKVHLVCLNKPGVRALIVRKTHASLTSSTLVTFKGKVAAEALTSGLVSYYGGSGSEPASFRYANGSVIVVGGLDRASRLLSTEFDIVFVDEAIEVSPEDLDTIVTRLRNNVLSYQQLLLATNPGPPTHHLKMRADEGRCKIFYSKHEDNPALYDTATGEWTDYGQQYVHETLESLTGAHYQRMRWGQWVAAEGQIYEGYDESVHVVDPFDIPVDWELIVSIDFGFTNPFVAQFWRIDHDGRMYLEKEIYETNTIVEDHARNIVSLLAEYPDVPHLREPRFVCDHDADGRATLRRYIGYSPRNAMKSVEVGIQNMQKRLRVQRDGKPRVFFFRDNVVKQDRSLREAGKTTSTIEEIPQYVWDTSGTKGVKESPLKVNDHGMDAMRYCAAYLDRVRA